MPDAHQLLVFRLDDTGYALFLGDVDRVDGRAAMAAGMAAMGFAMVPTIDSNKERVGRINMGTHPGMQTYHKDSGKADKYIKLGMVHQRKRMLSFINGMLTLTRAMKKAT